MTESEAPLTVERYAAERYAVEPSGTALSGADIVVTAGHPTPEELAAVIAVLTAKAAAVAAELAATAGAARTRGSGWSDYAASMRPPVRPGPGAWQSSTRTR